MKYAIFTFAFVFSVVIAGFAAVKDTNILKALEPANRSLFVEWASKKGIDENAQFLRDAITYLQAPAEQRAAQAKLMLTKYIKQGASRQINLPNAMRQEIETNVAAAGKTGSYPKNLFEKAFKEIMALLVSNINQSHQASWAELEKKFK